jgi:pimeloyl-ACP methyl ester carboxylesterase
VLYAHATGFNGRCWRRVAENVPPGMFHVAYDARGHGYSPRIDDDPVPWTIHRDDILGEAAELAANAGPLIGVGHSMGGATLMAAALEQPELFEALVVYEPIVLEPSVLAALGEVLAERALHRRDEFDSPDDAFEHFSTRPPTSGFNPDVLHDFISGALRRWDDGRFRLMCRPQTEAATYRGASALDVYERLEELTLPVVVLAGAPAEGQPSAYAEELATRLPNGSVQRFNDLTHFGPMEAPARIADVVARVAGLPSWG